MDQLNLNAINALSAGFNEYNCNNEVYLNDSAIFLNKLNNY